VLEIEADAFLHHMVRTLVGTMLEVGRHARPVESFARLLQGAAREVAGPTAPPHGLELTGVRYAGARPGGDRIRCYVTREGATGRELMIVGDGASATVPEAAFEPWERVDLAAYRVVAACTGVELSSVPRPLGMTTSGAAGGEQRTRAVWLQAPPGTRAAWAPPASGGARAASCRFAALPLSLSPDHAAQLDRLALAV